MKNPLLVSVSVLMLASPALAEVGKIPDPAQCTLPCGVNLVGTTASAADPRGSFAITIRDFAGNPVAGSSVAIDFGDCYPDIHICSVQADKGVYCYCTGGSHMLMGATDMSGTVSMRLVGGATNSGSHSVGAGYDCAKVYADGVYLRSVNVAAFDENGSGGVGPADVAQWFQDVFDAQNTYRSRSDFDCSQTITPADLAMLLSAGLNQGSTSSCAAYCN